MPTIDLVQQSHQKIFDYLANHRLPTPCLVMDLEEVGRNFQALRSAFPQSHIYYAVKANPAQQLLNLLVSLDARFDAASIPEIQACLESGAKPHQISFGNTIKKAKDIAIAYELGIRLFAFDSLQELEKLSRFAPGAQVYCRLLMECSGAEWPLSRKFGCEIEMAKDLLICSLNMGLQPYGISFHVGSQQMDVSQWDRAIGSTAQLFQELLAAGIELQMVNMGGGFPGQYRSAVPAVTSYAEAIQASLDRHFGDSQPITMLEPGRSLVADAGVINTEVVLISQKSYTEDRRWVFLDIGKFSGLVETMDEAIKYRIRTPWDGQGYGPVILAGPTCDSADILYDQSDYRLPLNLQPGDQVQILSTGAYTSTYSSVGFNGFAPLAVYCI
ncbi:MAG: type III PLP-dependent enzyme [Alkalinema sp. RU_4_3]|nr:type III PLP-dependent enzyme [Alkalinema sp. RU_4_3]